MTQTSRLPGFHQLSPAQRRELVAAWAALDQADLAALTDGLDIAAADVLVENVVGVYALPFAIAPNFIINGREFLIPLVIEEPSVVAALSNAARYARAGGGFQAGSTEPVMIGQIQLLDVADPQAAISSIEAHKTELLADLATLHPTIAKLGGGPRDLRVRMLPDTLAGPMLIVHLLFDTRDAMGANAINTAAEVLAPRLEAITGGRALLRILSNLSDERRAWASCRIPFDVFDKPEEISGADIARGIFAANAFALADPYRAATHNKGIFNGIDAVALATGQDWRAIEAGGHAYAARNGRYQALTDWRLEDENLVGRIELAARRGHGRGDDQTPPHRWRRPQDSRPSARPRTFRNHGRRGPRPKPGGPARSGRRRHPARPHDPAPQKAKRRQKVKGKEQKSTTTKLVPLSLLPFNFCLLPLTRPPMLLRPSRSVGIAGYGAYVPRYRLAASEVSEMWTDGATALPIEEKAVPGLDEDTATMAIEAARNAVSRAHIAPTDLRAIWVGSESHPYAVKPTSTIVAEALGAAPLVQAADWEFACKAGSEAIIAAVGLVGSGMADFAMGIGADTAQGRPGDALEYTAGAGAAAIIIGPAELSLARFEASLSYVTDTPDFWRRPKAEYPSHGMRFTGEPAYFHHVVTAGSMLLEALERTSADYRYVVLHQPNVKFPTRAAQELGFKPEQWETGLLVGRIGNTYSAASLIGLTAVLDAAQPGDRILVVSFGSGAGSDAISLEATEHISHRRALAPTTADYIARRTPINYATYLRYRGKLVMK